MIEKSELVIGIVRGPIGVDGDAAVTSCSGETAHFRAFDRIDALLGGSRLSLSITRIEEGPKGLLMRFAGYETPEKLSKLAGAELVSPRDKAAPLKKNEYYAVDLAGCSLVYGGKAVAKALSLIEGGTYDFLEVSLADGKTACVPFLEEFIGDIDLEAGTIELRKDWILE